MVTSTGSLASVDAWAAKAAAISSGVVASVSGMVVVHWQGSPYTLNPMPAGHVHARSATPTVSGGSRPSSFLPTASNSDSAVQSGDAMFTVTSTGSSVPVTTNAPSAIPVQVVADAVGSAVGSATDASGVGFGSSAGPPTLLGDPKSWEPMRTTAT